MNELIALEKINPLVAFAEGGLDPIILKIEEEARATAHDLDISTQEGRDAIASLAYKIARSKTTLDKAGKALVADQKEQIKKVDAERSRAWDRLEALQKEVRQPLTEWEEKEKARVAAHEAALAAIPERPDYGATETAAEIEKRRNYLELEYPARDWEEFQMRATKALSDEISRTDKLLAAAREREAQQAELERLRREEAERKQHEHEERLKAEAAEKARLEAEEKARKEAEVEAARVKAEQEKAELERQAIEREKLAAEQRARDAETAKAAAEEKAKADLAAAEAKALADAKAAAQRERARIEAEKQAEADAAAAREADKKHKAKINNEILSALVLNCSEKNFVMTPDIGKLIIGTIAKGLIPHVKISY